MGEGMRLAAPPRLDDSDPLPLWPPLLATRGPGGSSGRHAHHAMHVVLCASGELRVQAGAGGWQQAAGVVTAPDALHAIDARGIDVMLVFLDPESEAGASVAAVLGGPLRVLGDVERARLLDAAEPEGLMRGGGTEWTARLVETLGGARVPAKRTVHPRVKKVLALLRSAPPEADTSLEALAGAVGLSPGRLMHAFTESIGVPLRPYLLWLKLQRAAGGIVSGMPLAEAAHAAGFADAAHMSRTFKKILGTSPRDLQPRRS
jgi:AraC-like DNA-binding protein